MRDLIGIGNSGEYFVAAELGRHGYIPAVPMSNTPIFDLLAVDPVTMQQYVIQVKTSHDSRLE